MEKDKTMLVIKEASVFIDHDNCEFPLGISYAENLCKIESFMQTLVYDTLSIYEPHHIDVIIEKSPHDRFIRHSKFDIEVYMMVSRRELKKEKLLNSTILLNSDNCIEGCLIQQGNYSIYGVLKWKSCNV